MHDSALKEQAHLKRAAYYDSRGNTPKALAHFGRALYFGGKRAHDDMDVDTEKAESSIPKRGKLAQDVKRSLQNYTDYVAGRELASSLGSMRVGGDQGEQPPERQRRMSGYGR